MFVAKSIALMDTICGESSASRHKKRQFILLSTRFFTIFVTDMDNNSLLA